MTRRCPSCGHAAEPDDRFCSSCGTLLAADPATGTVGMTSTGMLPVHEDSGPLPPFDDASSSGLAPGTAELVVRRGPDEGVRHLLVAAGGTAAESDIAAEGVIAGRASNAGLFLDDITVSRRHASFIRRGAGWFVRDLGSLNGTYVNRRRIEEHRLANGDEVQIGKYRFWFRAAPEGPG